MNEPTDSQLLRAYAEGRSEAAFAELVHRHVDFVFSAALRMVRDPHLAEDATQGVFVALAKSSAQLQDRAVLSGWLHRTAQNIAAQTVRTIERRRAREHEAAAMNELLSAPTDASWENVAPHLDAALGELAEVDRDALLLRYFEKKSAAEMAKLLCISDDAAQKRVSRAVDRLRELISKRGLAVGGSGLVILISTNAVLMAPAGLSAAITAAAVAGTTITTTTIFATATKAIAMTTLQKTLIASVLAAAIGTGIYKAQQASNLRAEIRKLGQHQVSFAEQVRQLTQERDEANARFASLSDDADRSRTEILKLRNDLNMSRGDQRAPERPPDSPRSPIGVTAAKEASPENIAMGRELGMAVVRGDAGALEKVAELAKAQLKSFNTNSPGLNDTQRGDLARQTFAPLGAAFDVIAEAASRGNALALDAVMQAALFPELKGQAIKSLGKLAGDGNDAALDTLINPQKYGLLLSSTVAALRPAAENGNQKAIDALAAVAGDASHQALWFIAASGLSKAAESGNAVAIEALIGLSGSTNVSVHNAVVQGLKRAAANQNSKAAEALRSLEAK